jgi:hypothetical protein
MTKEDIHSYVVRAPLSPNQRENIQQELENFYTFAAKNRAIYGADGQWPLSINF